MALLDAKNKKILYHLNKDCRISSSKLAKKVGLSREVVDYRIKQLEKHGLIKGYITLVDNDHAQVNIYNLYMTLQKTSKEREKEIIDFLVDHPFIKWLALSSGKWDIITRIAANDRIHLDSIIEEFSNFIGDNLRGYDIDMSVRLLKESDVIFFKPEPFKKIKEKKSYAPDKKDDDILRILSDDARISCVDISKKVSLTPEAISRRIKKLKDAGIIRAFRASLAVSKLNLFWYMLVFEISNFDKKKENKIKTLFASRNNIAFADKNIGKWNLRVEVFVENQEQFNQTLRDIRDHLPDIRSYELSIIFRQKKNISFTKGMTLLKA